MMDEYEGLADRFHLKHGFELVNYRIELYECATAVHEWLCAELDYWMASAYG
jgi:hypothetical protein